MLAHESVKSVSPSTTTASEPLHASGNVEQSPDIIVSVGEETIQFFAPAEPHVNIVASPLRIRVGEASMNKSEGGFGKHVAVTMFDEAPNVPEEILVPRTL